MIAKTKLVPVLFSTMVMTSSTMDMLRIETKITYLSSLVLSEKMAL